LSCQALIIAEREAQYRTSTAVPPGSYFSELHIEGRNLANYAATFIRIPLVMANKPGAELLESLKRENGKLKRLTDDFRGLLEGRKSDIVSFYETWSMAGTNNMVRKQGQF
jgi:hypothetical protein